MPFSSRVWKWQRMVGMESWRRWRRSRGICYAEDTKRRVCLSMICPVQNSGSGIHESVVSAFATNWPLEMRGLKLDREPWMYLAIYNERHPVYLWVIYTSGLKMSSLIPFKNYSLSLVYEPWVLWCRLWWWRPLGLSTHMPLLQY